MDAQAIAKSLFKKVLFSYNSFLVKAEDGIKEIQKYFFLFLERSWFEEFRKRDMTRV